ncbi:MAG TPA: hypothetical protein DDZ67_12630 [Xanthomonadaceae bacterium]|nr:hypothetical protein [Xanthomonadaceae bacterium]
MNTQANNYVNKALLLLDRGDVEGAQASLRSAIDLADTDGSPVILVRALVILGDSLHAEGHVEEGRVLLKRALTIDLGDREEVVDYELQRARELLGDQGND